MNYSHQYMLLKELERRMGPLSAADYHRRAWSQQRGRSWIPRRPVRWSGRLAVRLGEKLQSWAGDEQRPGLPA